MMGRERERERQKFKVWMERRKEEKQRRLTAGGRK